MDVESKYLPLSARSSLPQGPSLNAVLEVLDALTATVLITDTEKRIRFFNLSYLKTYQEAFQRNGFQPEELINLNLLSLPNIPERQVELLNLATRNGLNKEILKEPESGLTWMSDYIPINGDGFSGHVNIQWGLSEIEDLSRQIAHYKTLAHHLQQEIDTKSSLPDRFQQIIGTSSALVKALRIGAQVAPTNSSVCILGESGTGKEVFAEAIHYSSNFLDGPLIKVNCAAIPESLMESELFGYEKGAFTGANANGNPGKFELANGGTLFLDEVGDMPPTMQVKLLRALQEREITRVGGHKPIKLNFRLITATHRDLKQMVKDGTFREDLFYRICIIPLQLPPLRERRTDIPLLAQEFLQSLDIPFRKNRSFSDEVLSQFMEYRWPGNIRELKNCVEQMAILCPEECITPDYLPASIQEESNAMSTYLPEPGTRDVSQYNLKKIINKVEYDAFRSVLSLTKGNKARAAEILGISKRGFYTKLEKFGMH